MIQVGESGGVGRKIIEFSGVQPNALVSDMNLLERYQ